MCLILIALATTIGPPTEIQIDEIKISGYALTRLQDPVSACQVVALSANGQQVVGTGTPTPSGGHCGFAWSKETGVKPLPLPDAFKGLTAHGGATSISDDGLVFAGSGLWIDAKSKIVSLFEKSAVPPNNVISAPLTDAFFGQLNRDGTIATVQVRGAQGTKLFLWRASTRKVEPILGRNGQRLLGHIFDMSAQGDVFAGCTFRGTDPVGFVLDKGKYLQVPPLAKFPYSKVECLTDDGKTAFGNYQVKDNRSLGFRWKVGSKKPQTLPKGFVVQSISGKGEIVAGWAQDDPSLLVGEKMLSLKSILKDKLPNSEIGRCSIVSVKKVGASVYLLLDIEDDKKDYRITLPASTLSL